MESLTRSATCGKGRRVLAYLLLSEDLAETGRVVLCGDAAFTRENLERGEEPAMDPAAARESLALIRSLVKDDLDRAFPSHDASAWRRWRHAPDVYR